MAGAVARRGCHGEVARSSTQQAPPFAAHGVHLAHLSASNDYQPHFFLYKGRVQAPEYIAVYIVTGDYKKPKS
jgi:hypothetical protein